MNDVATPPKPKRSPREIAAEVLAALMWGPESNSELADVVFGRDTHSGPAIVRRYVMEFKASGLVYIHGFNARGKEVFGLQQKPFEKPDIDPDTCVPTAAPRGPFNFAPKPARLYRLDGQRVTLREAARRSGMSYNTLYNRVHVRGIPLDEAMAKPVARRMRR